MDVCNSENDSDSEKDNDANEENLSDSDFSSYLFLDKIKECKLNNAIFKQLFSFILQCLTLKSKDKTNCSNEDKELVKEKGKEVLTDLT